LDQERDENKEARVDDGLLCMLVTTTSWRISPRLKAARKRL
jgi:hypothetical protein